MASTNNALSILACYDSDEDVEETKASNKRACEGSEDTHFNKKQITRLPLPEAIFTSSSITNEEVTDDPSLHNGRIRTFAHERGIWASYIYIPYEPPDASMEDVVSSILSSLKVLNMQPVDDFHISLTKTFILRHHWISSFVDTVRKKLETFKHFIIMFDSLKVYCNENRTRTFVGMRIKTGYDTLVGVVKVLDSCLEEFELPVFYKDPSFHMSIAWCVGDREEELVGHLPRLNAELEQLFSSFSQDNCYTIVMHLMCKTGNKMFLLKLS